MPQRRKGKAGSQLIELTMIIPLFLSLLIGSVEFGQYFYTYATLTKATRTAVRYISTKSLAPNEMMKAKNLAICGQEDSCAKESGILKGLAVENLQVVGSGGTTSYPQTVTVEIVNYNYHPIFRMSELVFGTSLMNAKVAPSTTMRYLVAG